MQRPKFTIPISILLFLAFTLVGTYVVRKRALEQAMARAMEVGDEKTMMMLLDTWPSPIQARHRDGASPLDWAAYFDRKELVERCLARGADVNDLGPDGLAPLHHAACFPDEDRTEVATLLIRRGADVNIKAMEGPVYVAVLERDLPPEGFVIEIAGETPLHFAVRFCWSDDLIRLLIAEGADVKAANQFGETPLHRVGVPDRAEILISNGADVNARDRRGNTPLHNASDSEFPYMAEVLIEEGANVNAKNAAGETPLAKARLGSKEKVAELLVKHGATE